MIHVVQYRPAFFDGFENEEHDVSSAEELLSIPFITNFNKHDNFVGYGMSYAPEYAMRYPNPQHSLMAVYDDGKTWWVVAMLYGDKQEIESFGIPAHQTLIRE